MHNRVVCIEIPTRGRSNAGRELMVFLMSDESRFITGAEIPVDGGQTSGAIAKVLSDAVRGDQR